MNMPLIAYKESNLSTTLNIFSTEPPPKEILALHCHYINERVLLLPR